VLLSDEASYRLGKTLKSPTVIQKTIVSLLMYLDPVRLLLLVQPCVELCKLDVGKVGFDVSMWIHMSSLIWLFYQYTGETQIHIAHF